MPNSNNDQTNIYKFRMVPIMERIIKQRSLKLNKTEKNSLIDFCLADIKKMEVQQLLEMSDKGLKKYLKYLFRQPLARKILSNAGNIVEDKPNNFDIRHKEVLRLFLKEYFYLFFPELAKRMRFETAEFKDKELIALFGDDDQHKYTDALILIQIELDNKLEWILIHWEHMGHKQDLFEKRMFHYFCGIFFQWEKIVLPIAMFTDDAKWKRKPVPATYKMSLPGFPINEFNYNIIKLKNFKADDFIEKDRENPLTWAYLPLTDYPKKDKPKIKAQAIEGILKTSKNDKEKATLLTLIDQSLTLNKEENEQYLILIQNVEIYKEVKMYDTIEEMIVDRERMKWEKKFDTIEETIVDRERMKWEKKFEEKEKENLLNSIGFGLEQKFGELGVKKLPEIQNLNDIELLLSIQKGLYTMNSIDELTGIYRTFGT